LALLLTSPPSGRASPPAGRSPGGAKGGRGEAKGRVKPLTGVERLIWTLEELVQDLEGCSILSARARDLLDGFLEEYGEALLEANARGWG